MNHPDTVPELLFIRRASNQVSSTGQHRWSSHIAFPGGRHDASDESALYTALRETWEEIGMDLAEREFIQVGRLDEREITTSLGKRLLMILSPFGASNRSCSEMRTNLMSVFLQTTPFTPTPELQPSEVSSIHWIPLSSLTPPYSPESWSKIEIDISTRLSPRNNLVRRVLRGLVGKMECVSIRAGGMDHELIPGLAACCCLMSRMSSRRDSSTMWCLSGRQRVAGGRGMMPHRDGGYCDYGV